jgi:hypothetical protein
MFILDISLYSAMLHAHSVGRWIVLLLLLFAIINSLLAGNRPYIKSDNRLGLLLTIFADLMLLIGVYLYFVGSLGYKAMQSGMSTVMKDPYNRFFAIILIHIGKAQGRRPIGDRAKHRRTMIFYLVALLIILASIPWPFREIFAQRGWF